MIYLRLCRGHGHREQPSILLLLICHLLYSTLAAADIPVLTYQAELVTFSMSLACGYLLTYSAKYKVKHLHSVAVLCHL